MNVPLDNKPTTKYSIIIPVFNEEAAVGPLHQEIKQTMDRLGQPYEIIFIDDGSKDRTFERLSALSPVKVIRFRKNFGQTAALDVGFKRAQGEIFITMDGDGQNDPADIPHLIEKISEGFDVVSGWRKNRKDTFSKKFISRGANLLRKYFVSDYIKDSGCTLKAYRRECFEDLDLFGEIHRFIPAMLIWKGFTVSEIAVNHRARTTGVTKYNSKRILKGFIDMLSVWFWRKYSNRPLHLFGSLGILFCGSGLIVGLYLTIMRILVLISLQNNILPLVSIFLILAGLQFFISGLLADIAIKTYYNQNRSAYSIRDTLEKS
jgi:glycosyltransferase involved in cell wall biosynthesis